MKKVLISLFLIAVIGLAFAQHTTWVGFTDSQGNTVAAGDIAWTAERVVAYPGDIITETTSLSSVFIPSQNFGQGPISALQTQCEDFANPWAAGQVVSIYIEEVSSGDYLNVDITLTNAGFDLWDPTFTAIVMTGIAPPVPLATTLVAPADAAMDVAVDGMLEWNASNDATGYKVYFGMDNPPMTMVSDQAGLTFDPDVNFGEMYYWQVVPYNAAGDAIANPVWSFSTVDYVADVNGAGFEGDDIPEDLPDPTVDNTGDGSGATEPMVFDVQYTINVNGAVTVTITLSHSLLADGILEHIGTGIVPGAVWDYVAGTVTFTWTFTPGKSTDTFVIGGMLPGPLAVEFASFAATTTAIEGDLAVELTWNTASEANLANFNVYRTDANSFENASLLASLEPTNSSTGSSYNTIDTEVEVDYTYYYWIESVDIDGRLSMHGPAFVTIDENDSNVIERTIMGNAYPNPFVGSTNITVDVKANEVANVTIYNILGQAVRNFTPKGNDTIVWDGTNANGKNCGSGIYFYRLTSPSHTETKKLVIVK